MQPFLRNGDSGYYLNTKIGVPGERKTFISIENVKQI